MSTPVWQAGTLYPNGSIVQPSSAPAPVPEGIINPNFASGLTGWTVGGSAALAVTGGFSGVNCVSMSGAPGGVSITAPFPVVPGQSITATCQIRAFGGSFGNLGDLNLYWLDVGLAVISSVESNVIQQGNGSTYRTATVTGTAPAGAAFVRLQGEASPAGGGTVLLDAFSWNYIAPASTAGLIYKAVQPTTGASAATEPTWPTTIGLTVVDNEVIWECIAGTRVVWEAQPLLVSGSPEPIWPTEAGGTVADGTIIWTASSRRVEDPNCPNTRVVAILASHVFAVDEDIVRFSAAINPLDWTSESNAGFLPTGLQQANANNMAVLATYRKNLVPMNANVLQLWAVDPDPELMQGIDQLDGIGSVNHWAATSVADDLFYLAALGVRSASMSGASRNLSSGDIGEPIDDLVQAAMAEAETLGIEPISTYYPSLGQYLLAFPTPQNSGWIPIHESGLEFTFTPFQEDFVSMSGSIITGIDPGNTFQTGWLLNLSGELPGVRWRITILDYDSPQATEDEESSYFEFEDADQIFNENTGPTMEFSPNPLFGPSVGDSSRSAGYYSGTGFETYRQDSFVMLVEVEAASVAAGTEVFVYTRTKLGNMGSWSRYEFPFSITEFDLLGKELYFRHGDVISVFDPAVTYDELTPGGTQVQFPGHVYWNYLDCGQPGSTKSMTAFDFIGTGLPSFSVGWDQREGQWAQATVPYAIDPDTLPGGIIPLNVWGPSLSMRVDFTPGAAWTLASVILYVDDMGNGP